MHALTIDDESRQATKRLVDFAAKRENWYDPLNDDWFPGQKEEYTLVLNDHFRICFSYTVSPEKDRQLYRHMTISVPGEGMPHPIAVFTIARMLGFTGAGDSPVVVNAPSHWVVGPSPTEDGVILCCETVEEIVLH